MIFTLQTIAILENFNNKNLIINQKIFRIFSAPILFSTTICSYSQTRILTARFHLIFILMLKIYETNFDDKIYIIIRGIQNFKI